MSFRRAKNYFLIKKPIRDIQAESENGTLKRTLSAANLISLGIGCIIGAGIFVITGQAAAEFAGPAILLSFVFAGLCCAFAGLCYAELASVLPVSGSAYTYAYATLGEALAWIMGWLLILEYGVSASAVAVGWSGYVVSFLADFGLAIPEALSNPSFDMVTGENGAREMAWTGNFNLPAALAILVVTGLLVLGVKESANVNNVIVAIKLGVILLFIGFGVFYIDPVNWSPFIPEPVGDPDEMRYGWPGVMRAAGMVFFAYVGFEAVSTASQEAKNPQRDIPIGILGSLIVCTILYIIVSAVLTGIVPYQTLAVPDPIAVGVDAIGLGWLSFIVKIGAIAGLSSVMLVLLYAQTRVFYAMSNDGLIPHFFGTLHKTYQTPWINTIVVGVIVAIVAGMTPIGKLGDLVSLGTLAAFSIICFSVIYLRKKEPDLNRPFRVPFAPWTPILGILSCGYLIWGLQDTLSALKWYFLAGIAIYLLYGHKRSRLHRNPPEPELPLGDD